MNRLAFQTGLDASPRDGQRTDQLGRLCTHLGIGMAVAIAQAVNDSGWLALVPPATAQARPSTY